MSKNLSGGAIAGIATGAFVFATVAMYAGKKVYKTQFNQDDNLVVNNEAELEAQRQAELEAQRQATSPIDANVEFDRIAREERTKNREARKNNMTPEEYEREIERKNEEAKREKEKNIKSLNKYLIQQKELANPEMIELPFKLLGLTSAATNTEVFQGYKNMVIKYHPDKSADSENIIKAIQDALTIIDFKRDLGKENNIAEINVDRMYDDINKAIKYIELKKEEPNNYQDINNQKKKALVELNKQNTIIPNNYDNLAEIDGGKSRKYRQSNQIKRKRKTKKYNKINK